MHTPLGRLAPPGEDGTAAGDRYLLALGPGVTATVASDGSRRSVTLQVTDRTAGGPPYTLRIEAQQASDLAVALVNAANGL